MNAQLSLGPILLFSLAITPLFSSCSPPKAAPPPALDPVSIKFSWHHAIQFLGFYVAEEQGYYAGEGLEVTLLPLAEASEMDDTPDQVASGDIDFAVGGTAALFAHQDGPVTIIAAIYQFSPGAFFSRADSGILTPADLSGRSVVVKSEGWRVMLAALLEHGGLTLEDINEVSGGYDMTPFYERQVDVWAGFITNEVIRARLHGLDIITLPIYEYGLKNYNNMIFTGQDLLVSHPDLVTRFLRATLRGWEWAVENPTQAVDLMLEQYPEMAPERDFHLASFQASIPLIIPGGVRPGSIDCQQTQFQDISLLENLCNSGFLNKAWGDE